MEKSELKIATTTNTIEAISMISSILKEPCVMDYQDAFWSDNDYILFRLNIITSDRDILFDLDSPNMDEWALDSIIRELRYLEIKFKLKLYGLIYDEDYIENLDDEICPIEGFIEHFENSPSKIWFEQYKDKMDYEEFKKEHPELLI